MFILVLLHKPSQSQFLCRGQHFAEDHGYWSFLLLLYWQTGGWRRSLNIWLFFQKRNNINCKKTMSSSPIPRAVLPAGNGAEWINVLLKLMSDGKGIAVLTAEPEIRKAREIPPLQCTPLIRNKPCYASGSSTFMITIKHFSPQFSCLCVLS